MKYYVMTLFPEMIEQGMNTSILGRAMESGFIELETKNIRDYTLNKHGKVDDYPYGGGAGMVMQAEPIWRCWQAVCATMEQPPHTIYLSPQGHILTQQKAVELSRMPGLFLLCGHYEGVDQRVLDRIVDEEISIGDYVLTGGELPALVLTDAVARMCSGVLPSAEAFEEESHFSGLLEHPQYTRPEIWEGEGVPEVLLSGHHLNVAKWKREESLRVTRDKRPDLYSAYIDKEP